MSNAKVQFDIFAKDKASQIFDKVKDKADKIVDSIKKIGVAAAAVSAAGLAALAAGLKKVTDYASVQEEAETTLSAVLRTTEEAIGYNVDQLKEYASSLQAVTTYGDETILSGMGILATFKQVRGEAFERATMAALDMSTVMQQDLKSSMVQLGKALNDPIKGLSALSDVGVSFTEQQREQVQALQESGDLLGAQMVILKELEGEFGGAAVAAAGTFQGAMKSLGNTFGDMLESLGFAITKNQYFIDLAKQAQTVIEGWIESINAWVAENDELLAQTVDDWIYNVIEAGYDLVPVFWDIWEAIKWVVTEIPIAVREMKSFIDSVKSGLDWLNNLLLKLDEWSNKAISAMTFGIIQPDAPVGGVQEYAAGTGLAGLPSDGLFYGHKGEIVKTAGESDAERAGRGSSAGATYNITIAPQFMTGDANAARSVAREIKRLMKGQDLRWGTA